MAVENRYKMDVNMKSRMFREVPEVVANDKVIFEVKVYDGSVLFPLVATYTYHLTSLKLGGQSVIREGTLSGDVIVFELGTSEMTVPGKVEGTVQIFDENNDRISSSKFDYVVKRDPSLQGSLPADNTSLIIANESLLTSAVEKSDTAITDSSTAVTKATAAETTANQVKSEFDLVVAEAGSNNPEVVQARGNYVNLNERLVKNDEVLADTESFQSQVDYVEYLAKSASVKEKMSVQILSGTNKHFTINSPISDKQGIAYTFAKNQNDDYIMMLDGILGSLNRIYTVTDTKNPDTMTGTYDQQYPPNYFTTTVGDSLTVEFVGTKISFYSWKEARGGLWEFILDEGTPTQQTVQKSVYNATTVYAEQTLFEKLPYGKHTVKAVFKGQDPANPVTTPRGWLYYGGVRTQDTLRTFNVYNDTFNVTKTVDAIYSYSNKEFALSSRPFGTTETYQWIPEHNAVGTAFKLDEAQLLVDGKEVVWNTGNYYTDLETVQLIQKVKGVHPSDTVNPLMEITTIHTIKNGIVTLSGKVKFLRKTEIDVGYGLMFPYFTSFAKKIKTSLKNVYGVITDNANYKEYWVEGDKAKSFVMVNDVDTDDKANIAIAMTIDNFNDTTRKGKPYKGDPFSWIEHRNSTMGKLYFRTFQNAVVEVGEEFRFDGRFIVRKIPKINQYIL